MELSACVTDEEYEAWRAVRLAVEPGSHTHSLEELRAQDSMLRLNEHLGYVTTRNAIAVSRALRLTT